MLHQTFETTLTYDQFVREPKHHCKSLSQGMRAFFTIYKLSFASCIIDIHKSYTCRLYICSFSSAVITDNTTWEIFPTTYSTNTTDQLNETYTEGLYIIILLVCFHCSVRNCCCIMNYNQTHHLAHITNLCKV